MAEMIDGGMSFLMRVRRKFSADFDMAGRNEKVFFWHGGKRYSVRVFKIALESGEQETLVTNICEKHLSRNDR